VLFPIGIFLYFMPALRQYGSLILNFLGIAIFVTIFDAILLAGFSQLATLSVFENMRIIVVIAAFGVITLVMMFLFLFGIVKSAFSLYNEVKRWKV
jgi:hypothetical protein